MKDLITIIGVILFTPSVWSQNFEWAKSMGGTDIDYGISIITDASGNVYSTGFFDDTVDFDSKFRCYKFNIFRSI